VNGGIALEINIQGTFRDFAAAVGSFLVSIVGSIIFALVLVLLSRFIRSRFRAFAERRGVRNNLPSLVDNIVQAALVVLIGLIALTTVGVKTSSLVTFLSLSAAALTLSLQDLLKNLFSGLYLLAEQPFSPGDRIRVGAEDGRVERVDLRITRLRNDRRELVMVPNSTLFTQVVGARATKAQRPLTVQLTGIPLKLQEAEHDVEAALEGIIQEGDAPAIRLLRSDANGCDLEVTVPHTHSDALQREIFIALTEQFPESALVVIVR
jgi:small-conductance mechanosensitive channel